MDYKKLYNIKMTMSPKDIMTFVSGLHDVQMDMIETVVMRKAVSYTHLTLPTIYSV